MIATNALLSIGFSIISNFANVVPIPEGYVPQSRSDLQAVVVGSPYSPTDLYLIHKRGTSFWIRDGVVYRYLHPGSLFELQNSDQLYRYEGTSKLTSNDVIRVATETL